jgi:hypothetical protein
MIEQKIQDHNDLAGSLLERYLHDEERMDEVYNGAVLRQAAARLVCRLPGGPVELLSTSEQGAGLAAACAALRKSPTRWRKIDLMLSDQRGGHGKRVLVEIVDPGTAWQDAVSRRLPDAEIIFLSEEPDVALAA